jgi:hypothetical protein
MAKRNTTKAVDIEFDPLLDEFIKVYCEAETGAQAIATWDQTMAELRRLQAIIDHGKARR